jgi:hypothetical protein
MGGEALIVGGFVAGVVVSGLGALLSRALGGRG